MSVHQGWDNFHNEPPFAERLLSLTEQMAVPPTSQEQFVDAVLTCASGNAFGVGWAATPSYEKIIRNFSPREVRLMLQADQRQTTLRQRLAAYPNCQRRFARLVRLIDPASVSVADQPAYQHWLAVA